MICRDNVQRSLSYTNVQKSERCSSSTQQSPCDVWCEHRLLNILRIQNSHMFHLLKASIQHIRQSSSNFQYQYTVSKKIAWSPMTTDREVNLIYNVL